MGSALEESFVSVNLNFNVLRGGASAGSLLNSDLWFAPDVLHPLPSVLLYDVETILIPQKRDGHS
jgi:hypothetical protein